MASRNKCSLGSLNTMYLSEMNSDRENTVFHMQCAASVAAPKPQMTKAQKNRAVIEAHNKGKTTPKTTKNNKSVQPLPPSPPPSTKPVVDTKKDKDDDSSDDEPKEERPTRVRRSLERAKSCERMSAGTLNTMYLSEMKSSRDDDYLYMQCAGSMRAPKKQMTKAQKNRAAIEAYNAKLAARKAAKAK